MFNVSKILVPTDFSDESYKALKKASDIAESFNAEIILLHVKVNDVAIVEQYLSEEIIRELAEKTNSDIMSNFEKQIKECVKPEIKVTKAIKDGIAYQEILKAENEFGVDLIVIASHTKTFFEDVLFGSTTEKVVRRSKKSVLVVRN
ncbi:MAG: universal stress protein [Calditerrivibrio sp.]|nr:universal stress protein [Calditerrivibrio sp.]MCA1932968.1 universal stress protein [Calditerrivibrio sp.]